MLIVEVIWSWYLLIQLGVTYLNRVRHNFHLIYDLLIILPFVVQNELLMIYLHKKEVIIGSFNGLGLYHPLQTMAPYSIIQAIRFSHTSGLLDEEKLT
ncbi:MAG: hypothetical protein ACO2ZZ_07765 [Cyclobacteriaceae bacterium]